MDAPGHAKRYVARLTLGSFEAANYSKALDRFRDVQEIDKTHSLAFCMAARCLKKAGRHQDAIRELAKLLSISARINWLRMK